MRIIKKKIKLIIFFIIFIIVAPIIILYAKGDIFTNGWNILTTGGIYVTKAPIGSEVFLNGKLKDTISFFNRDTLIKSLRPGTYEISVKKEGYNTWTNKLKVSGNLVSDANIFMLPTKVEMREIPKYNLVEKSSGTTTISTKVKNQEYTQILTVFASTSSIIPKKFLSTTTVDFKNNFGIKSSPMMSGKLGLWQAYGSVFVAWFGKDDTAPKYLCNESDCTKTITVFNFEQELRRINFLPGYEGVGIVAFEDKIVAFQIDPYVRKITQSIYQGKNPDFRVIDGDLYIKDGDFLSEVIL